MKPDAILLWPLMMQHAFRGMLSVPEIKFRLACFHAQQSVEKSLKAVLVLRGIEQRRTHDLNLLAQLLVEQDIKPPYSPEEPA